MTNGAGKHGHGDKKGGAKPKQTTKTSVATTLKKSVKTPKKVGGK
jgi:hypothetical protein